MGPGTWSSNVTSATASCCCSTSQASAAARLWAYSSFDIALPADFVPRPNDDEVESFALWPMDRVLERFADQLGHLGDAELDLADVVAGLIPRGRSIALAPGERDALLPAGEQIVARNLNTDLTYLILARVVLVEL